MFNNRSHKPNIEPAFDAGEFTENLLAYIKGVRNLGAISRGTRYAIEGRVIECYITENGTILGSVKGSKRSPYESALEPYLDGKRPMLEGYCSCPIGDDCKHCYAVALRVLGELYKIVPLAVPAARDILPELWSRAHYTLPKAQFSGALPWQNLLREAIAEINKTPWWKDFLKSKGGRNLESALLRGIRTRYSNLPNYQTRWLMETLWSGTQSRVEVLQRFNRVIRENMHVWSITPLADESGFTEWLESEEFAKLVAEDGRRRAMESMELWLAKSSAQLEEALDEVSVVWDRTGQDEMQAISQLSFKVLLTSRKLRRSPRHGNAIIQLSREANRGTRHFSDLHLQFLRWLEETRNVQQDYSQQRTDKFPVLNAIHWLALWGRHRLVTWQDSGAPVHFENDAAVLRPARIEGKLVWAAQLPNEAEPIPLNQLELVQDQQFERAASDRFCNVFVRSGNSLWLLDTGGAPLTLLRQAHHSPELPIAAIREQGLGQALIEQFKILGELEDDEIVQEVPVQVRVEFFLAPKNILHLRALAHGPEGLQFTRLAENCWSAQAPVANTTHDPDTQVVLPAQETNEAEPERAFIAREKPLAIAQRPNPADLAPVEGWLQRLVPASARPDRMPSGLASLSWPLAGDGISAFLEAWEARPPHVPCYGNSKMRSMVTLKTPPRYTFTVKKSGIQWLNISMEMQDEVDALTYEEVEKALSEQESASVLLPRLGRYSRKALEEYQEEMRNFAALGISVQPGEHRVHALQLGEMDFDVLPSASVDMAALMAQAQKLRRTFTGIPPVKLDKALMATLRPYQLTGVEFCVWACKNFGGVILADDMGLGKTLQVLATLAALKKGRKKGKPALVVCPASVTHNWQREAARFTPGLRTLVLERGADRKLHLTKLDEYDLIIKNYALARRDIEALREQAWSLVCVDEAQAIKNPNAAISRAIKSLEADYRIALTGTPIENRLMDLWSITDFAVPGYLGQRDEFERSLGGQSSSLEYQRLRSRLRPVLLRRLKTEVAPELPPRIEERLDCTMTAGQRKAYLLELRRAQLLLNQAKSAKVTGADRIQILAALTRLRQLCCDPALRGIPNAGSGKMAVFLEQLKELIGSGHKVLVFSQFVKMLDIIEVALKEEAIPHYVLTGKTQNRSELVARFEADTTPGAFLISLKAGGSGLNLVSANYVILFDPWWNPAVEAQAIDRSHRIGQDKTVVAYRLVTEDSIEERIVELQEKKRALVSNVLEADAFNRSLSRDDFAFLLE